ncbi:hypothetical protein DXG01_004566 [Tephrocybe rancida]|nr:hypothetical protein DXG01_004566 [Tephrocybe rancida]
MGYYDYDLDSSSSDRSESEEDSGDDFVEAPRPTAGSKRKRGTTNRKPRKPKAPPKPLYTAKVIESATDALDADEDASKVDRADSAVLARIRKAMKLATHPGTGEAEAKVAMRMASKLMAQQNLTQADLIANETAEERSTRAGNSRVRITSTAGKSVKNQRWHSNASAAACEAFDVQDYSERDDGTYMDRVFYGIADNTVAAALAFEMLHNQTELWVVEKKNELKGRSGPNSYRIGVSERVLLDAEKANSELLRQAQKEEKRRVREAAAAEEAARAAEIARLTAGEEEVPEPKVKVEDVPDEGLQTTQPIVDESGQLLDSYNARKHPNACTADVPTNDDDDSDHEGPPMDYNYPPMELDDPPMDYVDPRTNEAGAELRVDFESNGDAPDIDLEALEEKIKDKTKSSNPSLDVPKRRKPIVPTLPQPTLPQPAPPKVEPQAAAKEPVIEKPKPDDDTPSWTSALQLRTFQDNAKEIAKAYLKDAGIKLSGAQAFRGKVHIDSLAYYKGWDDGEKVDLKRRRIEGQHVTVKEECFD